MNKELENLTRILTNCINGKIRITLDYGDTVTNKSWNEKYEVSGYIGCSTGSQPIFLLLHNKRSLGGGSIFMNNILSIRFANKKNGGFLYKAPKPINSANFIKKDK